MSTLRRALVASLVFAGPTAALAQSRDVARPVNLLKKLSLPEATVAGSWSRMADGAVRCDSEAPARLRLARAPKGEYDLAVVFTRQESASRMGILLSYDEIDFGWFLGEDNGPAAHGFPLVEKHHRWDTVDQPGPPLLSDAKKKTVRFKVRREGVSAWLGKKKIGEVTDYYDLAPLDDEHSVGEGFIGILCDRPSVVIHAVTLAPFVETRTDESRPASGRESSEEPDNDEANGANDVLPMSSTWNGVRRSLNHHGEIHCNMKVVERNGPLVVMRLTERGCTTRWTFSLSGGNLILKRFTQESGWGSISEVQATGAVGPGRLRINYQWVYSGPRAARAIIVGSIYLEED